MFRIFKTRVHPVTGDDLSFSDCVSWFAQGLIRRWAFIILITLLTATVWFMSKGNTSSPVLEWWNLAASYMALLIESIVGIGMFSQTTRDALILRKMDKMLDKIEAFEEQILDTEKEILEEIEEDNAEPAN